MKPPFVLQPVFLGVLAIGAVSQSAAPQHIAGTITDSQCADAYHGRMRMGDTDAECVKACIEAHGATYVLYDGTVAFDLSDQKAPAAFAGQKVTVTGTVDAKTKTISVESIAAAK